MIKHYLTDDAGIILAVYDDTQDGVDLAYKQGKQLADAFPESEIYFHSVWTTDKLEVGMSSSMKGTKKLITKVSRS